MKLLVTLVLSLGAAVASADPATLYCQNMNSQNGTVTYVDLYTDYNASTDTYSKIEFDAYTYEDNFVYPNLFWKVTSKFDSATGLVALNAQKDFDNYLKFQLPGNALGLKLSRTKDVVDSFEFQGKGMIYGRELKGLFTCYDSVLFIPQPVGELPDDIMIDGQVEQQPAI